MVFYQSLDEVKNLRWKYYHTKFHYDACNPSIKATSAWIGHRPFAYDLVRFLKPQTIVELGTHWGASFFCFCQAVSNAGTQATCFAVDTWRGDAHSGEYGEEIYNGVVEVANRLYPDIAILIRNTFDHALDLIEDGSVHLLHIDGFHTLEAVTHDFQSWLPKLAEHGVVLFHDIAVKEHGFGVYQLWEELKKHHPSLEFQHSSGLGVLFPKGTNKSINKILSLKEEFQAIYTG